MNSSGLLLNVFRRKIWICLFIEFVIVLLVALDNIGSRRYESLWDTVNVAFGLGAALSFLLWFQTGCNRLPFPVSVRQRGWLPLIAFVIIWAAGGLAIILATVLRSSWPYLPLSEIPSVIGRIPLYLLAFMIVIRIVRGKPFLIGFLFLFPIFIRSDRFEWFDACLSSYSLWWPLALAALAYYVWEAPAHLGQQDRLMVGQTGGIHSFPIRDMQISERRVPLLWIGDVIEQAMVIAACILFYSMMSKMATSAGPLSYTWLLVPLLFTMLCRSLFQQAQCSGFGNPRAFGLALMQMTAILVPLAQALGVKKGLAACCDSCHKRKFLWQSNCLHCGNPGPGTVSNKRVAALVQGKPVQMPLRARFGFRAIFPLQIVFIGVLAGGMSGRPFVSNGISMVFEQGATQQAKERAIAHVKEWIEVDASLEDWHVGSADATVAPEDFPERYRLNVTAFNTDSLYLEGLGLRWDPAVILSEKIAQHLAERLADICPVRVVLPKKTRGSRSPAFQTRGYLDNQIHWKEPRK